MTYDPCAARLRFTSPECGLKYGIGSHYCTLDKANHEGEAHRCYCGVRF